ncbi:WSC domain-containing protein 2 [Chionoecetes opilio]|uniref:WSC domain-containing protein 2 n=1 Tax=Chionoecetes opilio TaxID=41210 RepID=A0A8J4YL98_CHIOP|nr:WSC domain-containing protein 2 [Chionoecetes opilio]
MQESALNAQQFGYRLTSAQKSLLDNLAPQARKELEGRVAKTRMAQDRIYLTSLRDRKQVVPRPGGGEQIMSYANRTVRFPVLLKKVATSNWPKQYGLYLNLTHHLWVRTRGCRNYSTTFAPPHSLSPRALASFPSSGNTWIRYLIEGATGLFTGSMYDDTSLTMKGLYGEALLYDSGMTVLQKSHGYTTGDAMMMDDRQQREGCLEGPGYGRQSSSEGWRSRRQTGLSPRLPTAFLECLLHS